MMTCPRAADKGG